MPLLKSGRGLVSYSLKDVLVRFVVHLGKVKNKAFREFGQYESALDYFESLALSGDNKAWLTIRYGDDRVFTLARRTI